MAGRSDREITASREWIKAYLERVAPRKFDDEYFGKCYDGVIEIIDTFFQGTGDPPLVCLAKSISLLAGADLAVFAPGWRQARGRRVEHMCCKLYEIPCIEDVG
jgi:hypothetical protein